MMCAKRLSLANIDKAAGHCNNFKKTAALVTTQQAGEIIDQFVTHGAKIPISACETLVGEPVFTTKTHCRNSLANQSGMCALQTLDTCSRAPAPMSALGEVADGAAIPQMLASVQWSRPNTELLLKIRRARVRITWGNNRGTRCPEIVVAVLANPIRSDPIGGHLRRKAVQAAH